uniref:Ig-like domain-containing protein n=1 Tax=Steinernema glaseri TaxID=37863 RepID=A0A1I7Y3M6_9BILA
MDPYFFHFTVRDQPPATSNHGRAQGIHADSEPYNATAAVHSESRVIRTLLADYDHRVRPLGTDTSKPGYGSVKVEVNLFLRSISNVNEANMEYTLQLTLRQSWKDPRLVFSHMGPDIPTFFVLTEGQQIWKPDTFFLNEKQAHRHTIDKPNTLFRLYKDGRVLYSVRLSMTLSCPMNLRSYPMDVQKCNLKLASYAYTTDDIEYVWKSDNPIQLNYDLVNSLPQFTLSNYSSADCTSVTNTGRYSCLQMDIELTREYEYGF